ncbi:arylamine N-acetyltransferase family protein [Actinoplanes couchii]|uniref:N-hydroxyarylamine O-acetyltransferase n=1 Tax=Actinoplanes couchii TaxID=403638 RepID=A0ABQ3X1E9_9ACTN|nr:arylamine N-acetyltransferase [Actinoplanes couchii]MDR6316604.1 N-hydroxyarylamine O-acetyltransferase [Actinoplanes couchii]GID52218.1 N-hydroxyarylamine O-acetyltransferase [Actinoplanes couchii]
MLKHVDVTAYLDRIGLDGPRDLPELHRAHLSTVPFENLSLDKVSLEPGDLFDKIVRQRRGGFCYELNGLFALLLGELGHTVTRLAARVFGAERLGPPYDHLALLVDDRWLADVGFGDHSTFPLDWRSRADQEDPGGRFRLEDTTDGDVLVLRNGKPAYLLETRPRELADFEATCWFQRTNPASHFTHKTICSRLTPDGRITISDHTLIVTTPSGRSETPLTDESRREAYRTHFGL